jgi:superfamily II DNA or RNA helicase
MNRTFSDKQKIAVELLSGCTGEADHIKPFSKGGITQVENCQIISSTMNKKKGAFNFTPHKWQTEFMHGWDQHQRGDPFLLIVVPGGGKTFASLEVCRRWMAAGSDRRIIVVVPSINLQEQWKDESNKFGIDLQTKEFGTNFKDGFQGGVVTYNLVSSQPLVFRKLCSNAPTMVVFDEIHHCGDNAHFGIGIQQAFMLAKEKLLLSGTPWKSDGNTIPFVKYDNNGYAIGDYSYDLPRSLIEHVVRHLVFVHGNGSIKNDFTGEIKTVTQEISDEEAADRLSKLLDPDGDFVSEQIASSHRKLMEYRKQMPDAACLAVCKDQYHAGKIAELIFKITGCRPSLIVSDSESTNDSVRDFRNKNTEWLVAVRMVSEGTDIKRLKVLCYLTNVTCELFFRQVVGRVSRVRHDEDYEACVHLPSDPRLIRCARNIENAQVQAILDANDKELREFNERDPSSLFESFSTQHDGTGLMVVGQEKIESEEASRLETISEISGIPIKKLIQLEELQKRYSKPHTEDQNKIEMNKEDRMNKLRKECNSKAFYLAQLEKVDTPIIHNQFNGNKTHETMTEGELKIKLIALTKACGKFKR